MMTPKAQTRARPAAPACRDITRAACTAALALLAAAPALAADPAPSPGRALAQRQGCLGCHAVESQLVGPAYQAVAERYKDQKDAAAGLAKRIRSGGTGQWGQMPMPPQAQLSEADARKLATWILAGAK